MYVNRDVYACQKRPLYVTKEPLCMQKQTSTREYKTRAKKELNMSQKTWICQKRHEYVKRDMNMSKETWICHKRPEYETCTCAQRDVNMSNWKMSIATSFDRFTSLCAHVKMNMSSRHEYVNSDMLMYSCLFWHIHASLCHSRHEYVNSDMHMRFWCAQNDLHVCTQRRVRCDSAVSYQYTTYSFIIHLLFIY